MITKLILLGIIIVTVIILLPYLTKNPSLHSLEAIIHKTPSNSTENIQTSADVKLVRLDQVDQKYVNRQTHVGQVFDKSDGNCKVSVPGLADTINNKTELTHIIVVQNCPFNIGDAVTVTKLVPKDNIPVPVTPSSSIIVDTYPLPPASGNSNPVNPGTSSVPDSYNVLQLTASNLGNDVMLNYVDTSGKTINVIVTLKNSEKEIFSGKFTSSEFHTRIKDVPNTPHIIEMTVESAQYGTLHASVYAAANQQNSTISGIFTK